MENKVIFRAMIEVAGKPKEHVENAIKEYLSKIKKNENYKVINEGIAEVKKQEDEEIWVTFAELEIETNEITHIISFCFDYMPSLIDIIEPSEFNLTGKTVSLFLNDLQAKLHQVDMVAKQVKMENDIYKKNVNSLLKNYITLLLSRSNHSSEQLSKLTGVVKDKLEDFLDQLIDENKIDLKEGTYYLKEDELNN
jgi:hypothetical protein